MSSLPAIVVLLCLGGAFAHLRMDDPPNRSSLWRFAEFDQYTPEHNYLDDALWCGNQAQFETDTRCGVCGDPVGQGQPRDNEDGGKFGRGIVTRTYSSGQNIPVTIVLNAPHGGYFMVQLCDRVPETEDCFRTLTLGNGEMRWPFLLDDPDFELGMQINTTAQLPAGVTCERCVLRTHYRGAQQWGPCDDAFGCMCDPGCHCGGHGCSQQQTFRSCSDIKIQ